jgi:hypothetical protein
MAAGGTKVVEYTSTLVTIPVAATLSGTTTLSSGATSAAAVTFTAANATATTAQNNKLTTSNLPRVWGNVSSNGSGSVTLNDGFNVTSVTLPGSSLIRITFAQAFANANFACITSLQDKLAFAAGSTMTQGYSTTKVDVKFHNAAGSGVDPSTNAVGFDFVCFGNQ